MHDARRAMAPSNKNAPAVAGACVAYHAPTRRSARRWSVRSRSARTRVGCRAPNLEYPRLAAGAADSPDRAAIARAVETPLRQVAESPESFKLGSGVHGRGDSPVCGNSARSKVLGAIAQDVVGVPPHNGSLVAKLLPLPTVTPFAPMIVHPSVDPDSPIRVRSRNVPNFSN